MHRSEPEWRFGRGWTALEIERRLAWLQSASHDSTAEAGMDPAHGYGQHFSEALIAVEPHGPPIADGPFERGRRVVVAYQFSDPRIVTAHFDPRAPLLGRPMLLELKVWGLRYLCGVRVSAVRDERDADQSVFGFRYHTVPPHIESGAEWFLLTKRHDTGEVRFRIEATWRAGQFPNWWSRVGFELLARRRQRAWHRLAHLRLRFLVSQLSQLSQLSQPAAPSSGPSGGDRALVHEGPAIADPAVGSLMPRRRKSSDMEVET